MPSSAAIETDSRVPACWEPALRQVLRDEAHGRLLEFVAGERARGDVFPPPSETYEALRLTAPDAVRVVILGQDPYHGPGQAHGLAFSVARGNRVPPSLRNIYSELQDDLGVEPPPHGCLSRWAQQGVLLLNTVLTVRSGEPGSHAGQGWEQLTDAVIEHLDAGPAVVFLLWGNPARAKRARIARTRHVVLEAAHPSPLSAYRGFFGSRPFSQANAALVASGREPVEWDLADPA